MCNQCLTIFHSAKLHTVLDQLCIVWNNIHGLFFTSYYDLE